MTETEAEQGGWEPVVSGATGRAIVAVVGLALWAQLVFSGLATEVGLTTPSPVMLAAYMAPPIVLLAGTYLGSGIVLLYIFPLTLLPAVAMLPDADKAVFFTPWSMGRIAATMAVFLALASAWTTNVGVVAGASRTTLEENDETVLAYRNHLAARIAPFLLLWLIPTYGIFFDDAVVSTFSQSYGENAVIAQIFVATSIFLVWAIVGYSSFIVPGLNLEYDRRKLKRSLRVDSPTFSSKRIVIRIAVTVGAGVSLAVLLLVVTS